VGSDDRGLDVGDVENPEVRGAGAATRAIYDVSADAEHVGLHLVGIDVDGEEHQGDYAQYPRAAALVGFPMPEGQTGGEKDRFGEKGLAHQSPGDRS
jgi:hypothetical protein